MTAADDSAAVSNAAFSTAILSAPAVPGAKTFKPPLQPVFGVRKYASAQSLFREG